MAALRAAFRERRIEYVYNIHITRSSDEKYGTSNDRVRVTAYTHYTQPDPVLNNVLSMSTMIVPSVLLAFCAQ